MNFGFTILDFGLKLGKKKPMNAFPSKFLSDDRKSKIQNPKWVGIFAIVLTFVFGGAAALAQQPKKVPLIGYLSARDQTNDSPRSEGVLLGLRELGYVDGQNIAIEFRYAQGRTERFAKLAAELVRLKVELIVAARGDLLIRPIMNTTKSIPIIMTGGGTDPVEAGFVNSLARPGGNVTGLTNLVTQLGGKRLEVFKEAVPKLARVAVLHDPATGDDEREMLSSAARTLKLTVQPWELRRTDDFDKVFAAINKDRQDGLYVSTGALLNSNQTRIVSFALRSGLPSIYGRGEYVDRGGLMYYGADLTSSYRRVAYYVDKILKGAKPADLPVEQPTKFEMVINLKTAKQIGVTIPQKVLARADRVIR
jgi:putative ABC transport system substrate-binding protein